MTRKELTETATKSSPLVVALAALLMAVALIVEKTSGRDQAQAQTRQAESSQIATLGTKLDSVIAMQEKNYDRLGKIEEKIDPLGNRVTALEARVGGLERVWSKTPEERP